MPFYGILETLLTTHFGVVTLTQGRPTSWTRLHDPQSTLIEFALRLQQPVSVSMATPPPVPSTNQKERDTMETDCISRDFHVLSLSLSLGIPFFLFLAPFHRLSMLLRPNSADGERRSHLRRRRIDRRRRRRRRRFIDRIGVDRRADGSASASYCDAVL